MAERGAELKAKTLIKDVLSSKEYKHFLKTRKMIITGSDGNLYWIKRNDIVGNVVRLHEDRTPCQSFCCHPQMYTRTWSRDKGYSYEYIPKTDAHIAQILLLKTDAKKFLRKANAFGLHQCKRGFCRLRVTPSY